MTADRLELMVKNAEQFARSAAGDVMCNTFPDLEGDQLEFTWDVNGPEDGTRQPFIIRQGEKEIYRLVVGRGVIKRFIDVAALLARRYGKRARDLVPSDPARAFLVGESAEDAASVDAARARMRDGAWQFS